MTMMELDPRAPTSIDHHLIGQLKSQVAGLATETRQLTEAIQKLITAEAARRVEMEAFTETTTDDRSIVLQIGSMLRDQATRLEHQTEVITGLSTEVHELHRLLDGVLKLLAAGADLNRVFPVVQI